MGTSYAPGRPILRGFLLGLALVVAVLFVILDSSGSSTRRVIAILVASLAAFLLIATVIGEERAAKHAAAAAFAAFMVGALLTYLSVPKPADVGKISIASSRTDGVDYLLPYDVDLGTFPPWRKYGVGCDGKGGEWLLKHSIAVMTTTWTEAFRNLNEAGASVSLSNMRAERVKTSRPSKKVFVFSCPGQSGGLGGDASVNLEAKNPSAKFQDENGQTGPFAINLAPGELSVVTISVTRPKLDVTGVILVDVAGGGATMTQAIRSPGDYAEDLGFSMMGLGNARDFTLEVIQGDPVTFSCQSGKEEHSCEAAEASQEIKSFWD